MHKATVLKALVVAAVLTLAVSAYAATAVNLSAPAMLNGKQIEAGEYQLRINSNGDVTFLRNKTEVATAKAKYEDRDSKAAYTAVITKADGDGHRAITEIQFEGKKQVLVFENTQASNQR